MSKKMKYWKTGVDIYDEFTGTWEFVTLVSKGTGDEPRDAVDEYIRTAYKAKKKAHWHEERECYIIPHKNSGFSREISYAGFDRIPRAHFTVLKHYFNEV